jgi:hypothetical protein
MTSLYIMGFILITMLAGGLLAYFAYVAPGRKKEKGFDFVYVVSEEEVRECTHEEVELLNRNFSYDDPNMPYIKRSFDEMDGGKIVPGFILRKKVPQGLTIKKDTKGPVNMN